MLATRFRKLWLPIVRKNGQGFSLIEILMGTVVFLGIGLAAFRIYNKVVTKATFTQQQTKFTRGQKQFFEAFRHQVENTIQIPNASATVLAATRPVACSNVDGITDVAWGLIPLPGYDVAALNAMAPLSIIDPSLAVVNETDHANDAVTIVFTPEDSRINYLAVDGAGAPVSTIQASPNDPVQLESSNALQTGDFAIVADSTHRELIRITGLTTVGPNVGIRHNYTTSIWNRQLNYNIGGSQNSSLGRPILYKVKVVTYALDTATKNLMIDDHILDDNFNPATKVFGTAGLAYNWQVVAPNINKFQIEYKLSDTFGNAVTRTPQVGIPGDVNSSCAIVGAPSDCDCANQLGNPGLANIRTNIEYMEPSSDPNTPPTVAKQTIQQFDPAFLKEPLPNQSASTQCDTSNILYTTLADKVTPNPVCNSATNPSSFCFCSDRPCDPLVQSCWVGTNNTGGTGYGGGGSG